MRGSTSIKPEPRKSPSVARAMSTSSLAVEFTSAATCATARACSTEHWPSSTLRIVSPRMARRSVRFCISILQFVELPLEPAERYRSLAILGWVAVYRVSAHVFGAGDQLKVVDGDVGGVSILENKEVAGRHWPVLFFPQHHVDRAPVSALVAGVRHLAVEDAALVGALRSNGPPSVRGLAAKLELRVL